MPLLIRLSRRWWLLALVFGIPAATAVGFLLGMLIWPSGPAAVVNAIPTAQGTLQTTAYPTAIAVDPTLPQAAFSAASPYPPATLPTIEPAVIEPPAESAPGQLVIQFQEDATEQERQEYLNSIHATVEESIEELDAVVITLPEEAAELPLPVSSVVAVSEPNYYVTALDFDPPNDPLFAEQWALGVIGAPQAWAELPEGTRIVTVAVIDSGVCADHPDLEGRIEPGWDFLEDDDIPQDDFGHGCAVTGVIAANKDNGVGIAGVAPNAQILPLRILDAQGVGTYSDVAAAIIYAADNGAEVINLSLGGPNRSTTLEEAVNYAHGRGVTVVAAAGNTGLEGVLYPAAYDSVIAVGSVEPDLQRSQFSSYGPEIELLAPGRDILTTANDGSFRLMSGTSFAAIHVSAAASLEIARGAALNQSWGVLSLVSFAGSSTTAPQPVAAYVRQVRTIDTTEIGVPNPVGLAFLPRANMFQVVDALKPGEGFSNIKQITLVEDPAGSVRIAAGVADPVNVAFDNKANRLLIFQVPNNQLIEISVGPNGHLDPTSLTRHDAQHFGLENPQGIAVDPVSGHLFILDSAGPRLVRIEPDSGQGFRNAVIAAVDLQTTDVRGLAFDPTTGHLHLFAPAEQALIELTQTGQPVATRDLSELNLGNPQGMVFAPTGDLTDDPLQMNLYLADSGGNGGQREPGKIIELSFSEPVQFAFAASSQATLVQTIDASQWSPPSPDSAGIVYLSDSNTLLISDSEVNEQPLIFTGDNLFEATLTGNLIDTLTTISFSKEPTGITLNPSNGHLFISDDNKRLVFEMDPGPDGLYDTGDDVITSFVTSDFGSFDPEGVTFASGLGFLYISDGVNEEVYQVAPGANGLFDGVPPVGDDQVASFDTTSLGLIDPEGIAFNSDNGNLYIVGQPTNTLFEVTTGGTLVQTIDISAANAKKPAGLAYAPGSQNPADRNIYIAARGKDNFNDGKLYELTLPSSDPGTPVPADTPTPTDTPGPSPTPTPTDIVASPTPTSPPGSMPAVDAVSSGSTGGSSLTISHTTSGADRLMLVGVSINNVRLETVSSMTYNGVPLTRVGFVDHLGSGDDDSRVEIWKRVSPSTGTHDVVITFSADLLYQAVGGVITFTGVDPIDPLGAFAASYGDTSSPNLSVPSASDERVLGVFACETCTSVTFSGAAVQHWNLLAGGGNTIGAGVTDGGAGSQVTLSASLGAGDHWALGGISIRPGSSGTATPTTTPTPSDTPTNTATATYTGTPTPTDTPGAPTPTDTPGPSPTSTPSDTATLTPTPAETPLPPTLPPTAGSTIRVPADFPTIQNAIDAAGDGDVVLVSPGTYVENLTISGKTITLASEFYTSGDESFIDSTIIDGGGGGSAVIIVEASVGPDTSIIGFTIQNSDRGIRPYAKLSILNNIITGTRDGIDYEGGGGIARNNLLENNDDDGIDLDNATEATIEDNLIRNNSDDGIEIRLHAYSGPTITIIIRNNTISGNGEDGIQLIDYPDLSDRVFFIEHNIIVDNIFAGIGLMDNAESIEDFRAASIPERIHIFNNTLSGNDYGLTGGDNLIALNNLFINSTTLGLKNLDGGSIAAYNLFWNNGTDSLGSIIDPTTTLYADPLLDINYDLQFGSPAIDLGIAQFLWNGETVLDLPPTAYFGTAPDLGWHESNFAAPTPVVTPTSTPPTDSATPTLTDTASAPTPTEVVTPTSTPPTDTATPVPTDTPGAPTLTETPIPPTSTLMPTPTPPPSSILSMDAVSSGSTGGSSLTISHTTSGENRLMLVGISINNDNLEMVSTMTYSGTPLTREGFIDHQGWGGDDSRVEIWKLVGPPTGTHDVVITFNADLKRYAVGGVITFTGVDPIDPLGAFAGDYATSSSASLSVPSASSELVLGVFACEKCNSVVFNSPVVEQWEISEGDGNTVGAGGTDEGAGSQVILSASLGQSTHWALGGISIRPSS